MLVERNYINVFKTHDFHTKLILKQGWVIEDFVSVEATLISARQVNFHFN